MTVTTRILIAQTWQERAACRGYDPELWYPANVTSRRTGVQTKEVSRAKAICSGCPVIIECLRDFMTESHGIFGGLTADERRALRRSLT